MVLSGEMATFLSGRQIEVQVHSLSYQEFLKFHNLKNKKASLDKYLKFGGLPYLMHLPLEDEIVFNCSVINSLLQNLTLYHDMNGSFVANGTISLGGSSGSLEVVRNMSDFIGEKVKNHISDPGRIKNGFQKQYLLYNDIAFDIYWKQSTGNAYDTVDHIQIR